METDEIFTRHTDVPVLICIRIINTPSSIDTSTGQFLVSPTFPVYQNAPARSLQYKLYTGKDKLKNYWKYKIDEALISSDGYANANMLSGLRFDPRYKNIF